jgi:hypothetical protein
VRSFSELAGKDLRWHIDLDYQVPAEAERHYVLYEADQPVVTAQAVWKRLVFFDFVTESGEGTYQVHIDLTDPNRRSVAWKAGESTSLAGFVLESEGAITAKGWITTASGRSLVWEPTLSFGYEYVVFAPGGARLITVSAAIEHGIGGTAGQMLIAPDAAADPELPAFVGLSFALACEQVMLLHRSRSGPLGSHSL